MDADIQEDLIEDRRSLLRRVKEVFITDLDRTKDAVHATDKAGELIGAKNREEAEDIVTEAIAETMHCIPKQKGLGEPNR